MLYRPLETATTIRLLDIHPGLPRDALRCTLRHVDVHTVQGYEAISYVWGEPMRSSYVICGGIEVNVTPSLLRVLRRVRLQKHFRTVWIDGLCINQQDDREKSYQVQLMRSIYRNATRVLVWLGVAVFGNAADAFSLCREVERKVEKWLAQNNHWSVVPHVRSHDPRWSSLAGLTECPWWSRLWVR
jgi:hypothetical protein